MIPYHPRPKFSVRPYNFRLVEGHPLWLACKFNGLGALGGGDRYYDSSQFRSHGFDVNDTVWLRELGRQLVSTNGTSNYIRIDHTPALLFGEANADCSITCWARMNIPDSASFKVIVSKGHQTRTNEWIIYRATFGGYLRLYGGNISIQVQSFGSLTEWFHMSWVRRNNVWTVYRDAVSVDITAITGAEGSLANTTWAAIGARQNSGTTSGYGAYDVADVLFHDRALSADEISGLADPTNVMLSGAIEPIPRQTHFLPSAAQLVKESIFRSPILKSRIIRGPQ